MLQFHDAQGATESHPARSQVQVGQMIAGTDSRRIKSLACRVVGRILPSLRRRFLLFLVLAANALATQVRADTVAHWRFEEGSANTVAAGNNSILDSSGNNLHGTPRGTPVYRTVTNHNSSLGLNFDNADDGVFINDNPLLAITGSLTLEAFIRIDSYATSGQIVWRGDDRAGLDPYGIQFIGDDNPNIGRRRSMQFFIKSAEAPPVSIYTPPQLPLPLGETFHVAGTLDDATGELKLFINGNVVAEATTSSRPFGALDPSLRPRISLGNIDQGGTQFFNGVIDEVRISNAALDRSSFLIPEPSTLALAALALVTVLGRRRIGVRASRG
jgi:hypothetical protein